MDTAATRVLLVDDEPSLLKLVSAYLRRLGYTVTTANTTEKAWTEMESALASGNGAYAVAVLDATMPGLSMNELAERMLKASNSLRILTSSGYPVDIGPLEEAAPGRVAFLHKPFTPEMLAATVRRMLAPQEEDV
ncbi:MAG: response regulator [Bryobacteraceae bacterium]|jgi:two-component system, cell cycle sensor histidine kinase and response regulator CckA